MRGDRHPVDRLVPEHEGAAAGAHRPLERRQEPRAQLARAQVGLARVAPAQGLGVAREVLGACQHGRRVAEAVPLIAAHHRCPELTDQERVLAEGLVDPAPAQVPGDAQHRRERPVDSGRRDLGRRRAGDPLQQGGIPGAGHGQLSREDCRARPERVAVDAVLGRKQRNAEPRPLGQFHDLRHSRRRHVQHRPGQLGRHDVRQVLVLSVEHQQLPDLLRQAHPGQQVLDPRLHGASGSRYAAERTDCPTMVSKS